MKPRTRAQLWKPLGRPTMPAKNRRSVRIATAFTKIEAAQIRAKAKTAGVCPARFLREAGLGR